MMRFSPVVLTILTYICHGRESNLIEFLLAESAIKVSTSRELSTTIDLVESPTGVFTGRNSQSRRFGYCPGV